MEGKEEEKMSDIGKQEEKGDSWSTEMRRKKKEDGRGRFWIATSIE